MVFAVCHSHKAAFNTYEAKKVRENISSKFEKRCVPALSWYSTYAIHSWLPSTLTKLRK
jgi:hypothetical protein